MNISIKVLNVGDGDAVIVKMVDSNRKLVFLIDGGHPYDAEKVKQSLDETLKEAKIEAPHFILCTHYDNDHIGGLFHIIDRYKNHKPTVYIHRTSEKINIAELTREITNRESENGIQPSEADDFMSGENPGMEEFYTEVLTNVQQEIKLLKFLKQHDIPVVEPIAEDFRIEGWPELKLLGPTRNFYASLFPDHFDVSEYLSQEAGVLKADNSFQANNKTGCSALTLKSSPITPTNLNSAILMLSFGEKKYLFAGDAGIDSLEAIPDNINSINNLYFLKAPHHGSKNNINASLIELMRPEFVYISGKHRISSDVVSCFENHQSTVYTTKDQGDLFFPL